MAFYQVQKTQIFFMTVEANSQQEALAKALDSRNNSYWDDEEDEFEVEDIDEPDEDTFHIVR